MHPISSLTGRPLDEIRLCDVQVPCIIGIYPSEARCAQMLHLQLSLFLDTRDAAERADLSLSVDYATLVEDLRFLLQEARFGLIETAAEAVLRFVLAPASVDLQRGEVEAASLEITKPEALSGLALPSLKIHRRKDELLPQLGSSAHEELVFSTPDLRLVRYTLGVGQAFSWNMQGWALTALRTVGEGLESDGYNWPAATTVPETFFQGAELRNDSFRALSIWCIARRIACEQTLDLGRVPHQVSRLPH